MEENYFNKIPDWPTFDILADELSGRIPVTKISSWRQFAEILEHGFFNTPKTQLVFRGHRRFDWGLTPSLGRLSPSGIITRELADNQIALFRRAVRGRLSDNSLVDHEEEDELWSVGQHHGLMTPLLDWTYSPFVALFFSFVKEDQTHESDNPFRVVYVLNKTFVANDEVSPDIRILEPRKDDHGRLVNQAGLFTFSPFDNTIENSLINSLQNESLIKEDEESEAAELAKYICKIYIANEDRDGCLRHLRRMNVHHASLFPDLLGASDYCNILVAEENKYRQVEEAAKKAEEEMKPKPIVDTVGVSDQVEVEIGDAEEKNLAQLLSAPEESAQVEPGRIQIIANELSKEFKKNKVVDWETRDTVQARLRNIARAILRKYGYPAGVREKMIDDLLEAAMKEAEKKE